MGIVFRARHVGLNRQVAIKMLLAGAYAQPNERERFRREAEAVARLRHPNVVQVYDVGEEDGRGYFTMEYVDGGSLAQKLACSPMPARAAAELLTVLAAAVHAAHTAGIVHRDLKPGNVLLTTDGTPKVGDFGLARRLDGDSELTGTGVAIGTPSYMAPEQVEGKSDEVGPAIDVYALGAILYELLTGRPPFKGETGEETLRQVVSQDPVAPSKLNPRVPRDLETVCLKCLHKSPARRYTSARELANDLGRFLAGEPILARPIGIAERTVKWARRRPTAAILLLALLVLFVGAAGTGIWLRQQEADRRVVKEKREGQARVDIEAGLIRALELGQDERWQEALDVLAGAATQIGDANSPELEQRLEELQAGIRTAQRLEGVRETTPLGESVRVDYQRWAANYKVAFQEAGLNIDDDPEAVAEFIRSSAIRDHLVAAVEHHAFVAFALKDEQLTNRLLMIARLSDRAVPWAIRLHDPAIWSDRGKLKELAAAANAASPPPTVHQLGLLGLLLQEAMEYSQSTQIFSAACRRRPWSFWLNHETAFALLIERRNAESAAYYRNALNLRPDNADVCSRLAMVLLRAGETDEALAEYRRAVELSTDLSYRLSLVQALASTGYWKDAEAECQRALQIDPTYHRPYTDLALALMSQKRYEDSAKMFRRVYEIDPNAVPYTDFLGGVLADLGRHEEAVAAYRRPVMKKYPKNNVLPMFLAKSLIALGRKTEALDELRAAIASDPGNDWILPELKFLLRAEGQTDEAIRTFRELVTANKRSAVAWDGLIEALLDHGQFADAREAVQTRLTLYATDLQRRTQRRQLEICNLILAVESKLPAILDGKEEPTDVPTKLAVAEWCLKHSRRTARAVMVYASVLSTKPLSANLIAAHRFDAACAAALAGCGVGEDVGRLDDYQRAELRKQAFDWLTAEYDAWAERHRAAKLNDCTLAATTLRTWSTRDELKEVRDAKALAKLPTDEQRAWKALWEKVVSLAAKDPKTLIAQARALAGHCEWKNAAASYAAGIELEPTDNGDLWFEYAACQLLAEDRPGFRRSCAHMMARCQASTSMRTYLAARACTLAPDSTEDLTQLDSLSNRELQDNLNTVWAATEISALSLRSGNSELSLRGFEKSLLADRRPGRAVVSRLWLALAHQKLGKSEEARRYLVSATHWLDQQTGQAPIETPEMGSHLHNWLEAHVLRKEVEQGLR
jgi:serine/threonine-protein kinase